MAFCGKYTAEISLLPEHNTTNFWMCFPTRVGIYKRE